MAGDRALYEQAMNAGHSAAWDQEWDKAITAYARAIQEFPEDPSAHNSLGLALLQAGRYEDSLKVYSRAIQLAPDDPVPLEKSADVLERLGRLQEAAQRYVSVADIYMAERDMDKAIGNWERATRLTPGMLKIHYLLAQAYERTGQKRSAVREYLTLAFNFQRGGDKQRALQAAERAKRLEPTSPQVLNSIQAIQSDALMMIPDIEPDTQPATRAQDFSAMEEELTASGSNPKGPLGETVDKALAVLAEYVLSGDLRALSCRRSASMRQLPSRLRRPKLPGCATGPCTCVWARCTSNCNAGPTRRNTWNGLRMKPTTGPVRRMAWGWR
jgi:tetratricopeptide (TPR) repeat protein